MRVSDVPADLRHGRPGLGWRTDWVLALAMFGGLVVRWLYFRELVAQPEFCHPMVDAAYNDAWARALTSGDWTPTANADVSLAPTIPFYRPPGYPYFLAGVYWLLGTDCAVPVLVQMGIGLCDVVLAYHLGSLWIGRQVGRAFALGMALYWIFPYFEGELLAPALLTPLLLAALTCLGHWAICRRWAWTAGAAFALGCFALVRPNILAVVPLVAGWMVWVGRRAGVEVGTALRPAGALLAIVGVCVSVATIRNAMHGHEFVVVSSNAGVNLLLGNNARATGTFSGVVPGYGSFGAHDDYRYVMRAVERKLGRPVSYSEVSAHLASEAGQFVLREPRRALRLLGAKLVRLVAADEHGHNRVIHFDREFSPTLSRLPGDFGALFAFAILGWLTLRGRDARKPQRPSHEHAIQVLLSSCGIGYGFTFLPFFITGQYRVPIIPCLIGLGAAGFVEAAALTRARDYRRLAGPVLAALIAFAVSEAAVNGADSRSALSKWHFGRALAWEYANDPAQAAAHYTAALEAAPAATMAAANLSVMYAAVGKSDRAEFLLREGIREGSPRPGDMRGRLAALLLVEQRFAEAKPLLRDALAMDPDQPKVHTNLGILLAQEGDYAGAAVELRHALLLDPDSANAQRALREALGHQQ